MASRRSQFVRLGPDENSGGFGTEGPPPPLRGYGATSFACQVLAAYRAVAFRGEQARLRVALRRYGAASFAGWLAEPKLTLRRQLA
jgi:hypothetical protein